MLFALDHFTTATDQTYQSTIGGPKLEYTYSVS